MRQDDPKQMRALPFAVHLDPGVVGGVNLVKMRRFENTARLAI